MAFGTLELTLRPLKLAFLVDPADTAVLTEAIQINTFLWGGMFNPIVPVFRRLPAVWRERFHGHLTAQALVTERARVSAPDPAGALPARLRGRATCPRAVWNQRKREAERRAASARGPGLANR